MADWIKDGGAFTWLMLGMSVVALAFILERAWALRRARVMPEGLAKLLGTADPAAQAVIQPRVPSRPAIHGAERQRRGAIVLFPAPGGAANTATPRASRASSRDGRTSSTGNMAPV